MMSEQKQVMSGKSVSDSVDDTSKTLHDAIDSTSQTVSPALNNLSECSHKAVNKLADVAVNVAESLEQESDSLRKMKVKLLEQCRAHINDKPLMVLGLAISSGFLVGWLLKKR
ncbi:hypothetical protein [Aeromonas popoffii]|uniref:DUF883 family protein n=1 Tax=Aeromonas popoffii TaxID=70856 RepID=UPI0030CFF502